MSRFLKGKGKYTTWFILIIFFCQDLWAPLYWAAKLNYIQIARILVENGADLNCANAVSMMLDYVLFSWNFIREPQSSKQLQCNLSNLIPEFSNILFYPTHFPGPKIVLSLQNKPDYSTSLLNPTFFCSPVCLITQVNLHCTVFVDRKSLKKELIECQ